MPSRYDDELWELVPEEPGPPRREIVRFVRGLGRVGSALDLGCGDGRLTAELDAAELVAADPSDLALGRARSRVAHARLVPLTPDEPLPFEEVSFDLVLCAQVVEHVRDLQLFLSEARRVVRPGGRLALTTPGRGRATALRAAVTGLDRLFPPPLHPRFFSRRSLATLLDELGFDAARVGRERGTLLATAGRGRPADAR